MSRKKPSRRQLESLCADVHPDDGLDPKAFLSASSRRPRPMREAHPVHRKTLQLCSQVADTLNLVLSGECSDEFLQSLQVVAVRPAPNAAQLLVLVTSSPTDPAPDPATISAPPGRRERTPARRSGGRHRATACAEIGVSVRGPQFDE